MIEERRNHDNGGTTSAVLTTLKRSMGRPVAVVLAVVVTAVAFVGGCSDDDPSPGADSEPGGSSEAATDERPLTTTVTVGRVVGTVRDQEKQLMKDEVGALVDGFFEGAYLGEFPRTSFDDAYSAFTDGAREDAQRDAALLSNADLSGQIETATGTKRRVALDVLAVKGKVKGVTARFTLQFDTTGDLEQTGKVKGYLLLDHQNGTWRVFGYDIVRSVVA